MCIFTFLFCFLTKAKRFLTKAKLRGIKSWEFHRNMAFLQEQKKQNKSPVKQNKSPGK